jgi:hypothetical protein
MGQPIPSRERLRYSRGSKDAGIESGTYSTVVALNPTKNLSTIQIPDGSEVSYDPKRLSGVSVYFNAAEPAF